MVLPSLTDELSLLKLELLAALPNLLTFELILIMLRSFLYCRQDIDGLLVLSLADDLRMILERLAMLEVVDLLTGKDAKFDRDYWRL